MLIGGEAKSGCGFAKLIDGEAKSGSVPTWVVGGGFVSRGKGSKAARSADERTSGARLGKSSSFPIDAAARASALL